MKARVQAGVDCPCVTLPRPPNDLPYEQVVDLAEVEAPVQFGCVDQLAAYAL